MFNPVQASTYIAENNLTILKEKRGETPLPELVREFSEDASTRIKRATKNRQTKTKEKYLTDDTEGFIKLCIKIAFLVELAEVNLGAIPLIRAEMAAKNCPVGKILPGQTYTSYRKPTEDDIKIMTKFFTIVQKVESGFPIKLFEKEIGELHQLLVDLSEPTKYHPPRFGTEGAQCKGH